MSERTVLVISAPVSGEVLRVFTIPTAQVKPRDKEDIKRLAAKYNQVAKFFELEGWSGIEAVKWDIKEMNGDTEPQKREKEAKELSQNAARGRTTWGGGMR